MQSSPAYVPVDQDNPSSSTVPQYETVQAPSDHQDVPMMANPAYLTIKTSKVLPQLANVPSASHLSQYYFSPAENIYVICIILLHTCVF